MLVSRDDRLTRSLARALVLLICVSLLVPMAAMQGQEPVPPAYPLPDAALPDASVPDASDAPPPSAVPSARRHAPYPS